MNENLGATQAGDQLRSAVSNETLIRIDEPLARRTTLRVGGPADVYVEPASENDLAAVLQIIARLELPILVLGRGSNLLVKDGGFRGVAICLGHSHWNGIAVTGRHLQCGAGARLKAVASEARLHGLSGLEFLEGIPGTVGGGLRMNAGAMGGAIFEVVESVRVMDFEGRQWQKSPGEMQVEYRRCGALRTQIALSAVLCGQPGSREAIAQRMNEFSRKRWQSQPAAPSAGCIFKNPITIPAGKLIDELGLKGARVGGASVSPEHGNFIVNDGSATARDVLELIELIRQRARSERRIELETEVEIVGE
ncbi:UDP-N-acetylenolpyruvoylglucosamine reductase [Verrucomicrobia bacterium]|nr:UDP-N-acetylenolpyruvoylglucosamine reductase [Verrucomicrobiota bacterium]